MKINRQTKRSNKLPILAALSLIIVAIPGFLYYAHHYQRWPFTPKPANNSVTDESINYSSPTKSQVESGNGVKESVGDRAKDTSAPDNSTATIPVTITAVQPGSTVYIRANIERVTASGTCDLAMSGPNGKSYNISVPIQSLASSSTCKGFNIPMSELTSGNWKITITVKDGDMTGVASTEKTL